MAAWAGVCAASQAQLPQWRHVADYTDTHAMIATQGMVVTASSRGAAFFTPEDAQWAHASLPEGLLTVDLLDVCTDEAGTLFWSGADASISALRLDENEWSRGFLEFRGHDQIRAVNDLWGGQGLMMASHSTGITLFDYLPQDDEFLVRWNLHQLGSFPNQSEVLASAALGSLLVAVTAQGLAWGEGWPSQPTHMQNLAVPGALGTISQAWLAQGGDRLYALLRDPQGRGWLGSVDAQGEWRVELSSVQAPQALAANESGWTLAMAEGGASRLLSNEDGNGLLLPQAVGALAHLEGGLVAALLPGAESGGLVRLSGLSIEEIHRPDVPGAEDFVDLDFAPDGSLWVAGVSADMDRNGLYHRGAEGWTAWKLGYGAFGNYPTSLACNEQGGVWFGTWGQGLGLLRADGSVARFAHDAGPAHRMVGFANAQVGEVATFPLVSDVQADAAGNIWVVNHQALDDSCLVVIPAAWQSDTTVAFARHTFAQYGLRFPWSILPTSSMGVWAGIAGKDSRDEEKRLLRLNSRGLPVERLAEWRLDEHELADAQWNFSLSAPGTVQGLAADAGNVWIATSDGFYVGGLYGGVAQFSRVQFIDGLVSEQLAAVGLDGRGRVWVGADEGLSVYDPLRAVFQDPGALSAFNAMVRQVDGLALRKVAVDPRTGELWVATSLGLFACPGLAVDHGGAPQDDVHMYPNPFRPDGSNRARLLSGGLANDATVSILDANGRVLRRLNLQEAEEGWDGRDKEDRPLESGVYLLLVTSSGGSGQGKIAIIR
jgi:hypothetical protein